MPVLLGFAGTAEISNEAATALLRDLLDRWDPETKISAVIPLAEVTDTPTEKSIVDHLLNNEIAYVVITDGSDTREQRRLVGKYAEDELVTDEDGLHVLAHDVIKELVAVDQADEGEAILILALGEDPDAADDLTRALLEGALANDITVLDLTNGLIDITEDEPEPEQDVERSNEDEVPSLRELEILRRRADSLLVEVEHDRSVLSSLVEYTVATDSIVGILSHLVGGLSTIMDPKLTEDYTRVLESAVKQTAEVRRSVSGALERSTDLLAVLSPESFEEHVEPELEPEPIGKSRAVREPVEEPMEKVVRLASGEYRKFGPGRRPGGSKVVEIPRSEFEELGFAA